MKAKYVIIQEMGLELPIVFNPIIDHSAVCQNKKVISAGYVSFDYDTGNHKVYGRSVTLNVSSRLEDAEIIRNDLQKDL